jgi:bacillopeptidase F
MKKYRGGYRKRRKKSLSRVYLLLLLIFSFVVFKWGFSFLIEVIGKTGGNSTQTTELNDTVAPQTPVISALPEATNSAQIKIEGYTEADAEVEYLVNSRKVISEQTDESGFYKAVLDLEDGENLIQVTARDQAGNESSSEPVKVVYDFKTPEIKIVSPTDGQEFFGVQKQNISVYGEVSEADANLKINNTFVRLDNNGLFDQQVRLNEGENEIKLVATDMAGNLSEVVLKVSYVR